MAVEKIDPSSLAKPREEDENQLALFEAGEKWEELWRGMPQFVQYDLEPFKTMYVHFATKDDGRLKMAQSLVEQHPDVTKIVQKWGRWQHHVDYRPFARNKLKPIPGAVLPPEDIAEPVTEDPEEEAEKEEEQW